MPIVTLSSDDEPLVAAVEKAENQLQSAIIELEAASGLDLRYLRNVVYDHERSVEDRFAELRQEISNRRLRQTALAKLSVDERTALGVKTSEIEKG